MIVRLPEAGKAYAEGKQILAAMKLTGHHLDEWYAKARGGDETWFSYELEEEPKIRVDIRTYGRPGPEPAPAERQWFVNVNVQWRDGDADQPPSNDAATTPVN